MPLRPQDLEALAAVHYADYPEPDQQLFALLVDAALAYHAALRAADVPDLEHPTTFAPATLAGVSYRDALLLGLGENLDMRLPHLPVPQADGLGPCQVCAGPLDAEVHAAAG
jgi:hypothetical protein